MTVKTIGIRDLKTHLSHYLREVRTGSVFIVTDRNRPVARIEPIQSRKTDDLQKLMLELRESGELEWDGQLLTQHSPQFPTISLNSDLLASDLLLEDRR